MPNISSFFSTQPPLSSIPSMCEPTTSPSLPENFHQPSIPYQEAMDRQNQSNSTKVFMVLMFDILDPVK